MKQIVKIGLISVAVAGMLTGCFNQNSSKGTDASNPETSSIGQGESAPWIATKNTTRINSSDPFAAATLVSKTLWPATSEFDRPGGIVIVDPSDWQVAAVSADLVHFPNNGPVLFTNKDQVPDITLNELKRLKPTGPKENQGIQVILVGDLDKQVEDQIRKLGFKTDRVQGGNPADYAKKVDDYYAKVAGSLPQSVIVGSMDSADFTMPAVNWIAHMPESLLYVKKNEVPKETAEALKKRNGKATIYLLGPESVVSGAVEKELAIYGQVKRISGRDAYENAIAFAKYKDESNQFGWGITSPGHNVSVVNKESIPLAIAAAPFSHLGKHAPLIWSNKEKMPSSVMTYLMSIQPKYKLSPAEGPYNHAWLTGDAGSFTAKAQSEIDSMLEIVSESGEGHGSMHGTSDQSQAESLEESASPEESSVDSGMHDMKH